MKLGIVATVIVIPVNATNRRHLFANWQGSISAITDASGNVVQVNAYDAYGIPNATNLGRFQYTRACAVSGGHGGKRSQILIPEIGIYHYKARAYSPYLGRFLQTDPIGYEDQFNLYAYVGNDPMNARDPTGMDTACGPTEENCSDPGYGEIVVIGPELTDNSQNDVGILISRNYTGPEVREDELPQSENVACKLGKALEISGKVYGDTATGGAVVGGAIGMLAGLEASLGIAGAFLTHSEYGAIAASAGQAVQDLSTEESLLTTGDRFLAGVAGGRVGQSVGRVARVGTFLSPVARKVLDGAFGEVEQRLIGLGIPEIDPDSATAQGRPVVAIDNAGNLTCAVP